MDSRYGGPVCISTQLITPMTVRLACLLTTPQLARNSRNLVGFYYLGQPCAEHKMDEIGKRLLDMRLT